MKILAEGILPHKRRFDLVLIKSLSGANCRSVGTLFIGLYINVVPSTGVRILLGWEAARYFVFVEPRFVKLSAKRTTKSVIAIGIRELLQ